MHPKQWVVSCLSSVKCVLSDIRENQLRLKREMDALRDELFTREEEEAIIVDNAHVVTESENSQTDSEAKRAWDARAKHLKQVR
jgi:hypothetical protein